MKYITFSSTISRSTLFLCALFFFVGFNNISKAAPNQVQSGNSSHPSSSVDYGYANTTINAPIEQVAKVITDFPNYRNFMPNFNKSKVLSRRGNDARLYLEIGVARNTITLWAQVKITTRQVGTKQIVTATMIEGNMDNFSARWELTPSNNGAATNIRFRIHVEPSLPLPSSLYSRENINAAKQSVKAVKTQTFLRSKHAQAK